MSLPEPERGLVICYSYLWSHEASEGAEEGRKNRPCVIIAGVKRVESGQTIVTVLPITHSEPDDPALNVVNDRPVGDLGALPHQLSVVCAIQTPMPQRVGWGLNALAMSGPTLTSFGGADDDRVTDLGGELSTTGRGKKKPRLVC